MLTCCQDSITAISGLAEGLVNASKPRNRWHEAFGQYQDWFWRESVKLCELPVRVTSGLMLDFQGRESNRASPP